MKTNNGLHKQWYRPKEVATYLGISIAQVWILSRRGKLTPKKLSPNITIFNVEEINALIR